MSIREAAKKYHERMFPGYKSKFLETDPEFIERFDNFAFDEVVNSDDLEDRTRMMAILATLIGSQSVDEFKAMVPAALNFGVTIEWIKEDMPVSPQIMAKRITDLRRIGLGVLLKDTEEKEEHPYGTSLQ